MLRTLAGVIFNKKLGYGVGIDIDLGISANAGEGGRALIVMCSSHTDEGDKTNASIFVIRCGYKKNYIEVYTIKNMGISAEYTFHVMDNGNLAVTNPFPLCKYIIFGT